MNNKIKDFITKTESEKFAINIGLNMHAKLQNIDLGNTTNDNSDLITKINNNKELKQFFNKNSKSEVPIAGIVNGRFISRRIDRLIIDEETQTIRILDYKTDVDTEKFRSKYIAQLREYSILLKQIYPDYKISCYILWLHNWELEHII